MNGAEHYRMAEKLLSHGDDLAPVAQVHATLALAAAIAMASTPAMPPRDGDEWCRVAGVKRPKDGDL